MNAENNFLWFCHSTLHKEQKTVLNFSGLSMYLCLKGDQAKQMNIVSINSFSMKIRGMIFYLNNTLINSDKFVLPYK